MATHIILDERDVATVKYYDQILMYTSKYCFCLRKIQSANTHYTKNKILHYYASHFVLNYYPSTNSTEDDQLGTISHCITILHILPCLDTWGDSSHISSVMQVEQNVLQDNEICL